MIEAQVPDVEIMGALELYPHEILTVRKPVGESRQCFGCSGSAGVGNLVLGSADILEEVDRIFVSFQYLYGLCCRVAGRSG